MAHVVVRSLLAGAVVVSFCALGCSKKPAEAPESAAVEDSGPPPQPAAEQNTSTGIEVSPSIASACGLSQPETFFEYNSARLTSSADALLAKLATCFTTGPLAGKTMNLVGHADPRGDDEYNLTLGGSRADSVAAALEKKGLPQQQMNTTSRGELEATGMDEASWARDRRVAIVLAD